MDFEKIKSYIEKESLSKEYKSYLVNTLKELVQIESISGNEKRIGEYLFKKLNEFGFHVSKQEVKGAGPNIIGKTRFHKEGHTIMLSGHMDTVPPCEGWDTDPFSPQEKSERIYGLGSYDMKGGVASILTALKILTMHDFDYNFNLIVAFLSDEENIDRGAYALVKNGISADVCYLIEPTDEKVDLGAQGRYSIEGIVRGKSGHTSRYPSEGVNALRIASKIIPLIEEVPRKKDEYLGEGSICVIRVKGGDEKCVTVPDSCRFIVSRQNVIGESLEDILRQFSEAVPAKYQNNIEFRLCARETPYLEPYIVDPNFWGIKALVKAIEDVKKRSPKVAYSCGTSDANYLVNLGKIPTVEYGPQGNNMHSPNEYVEIDSLERITEVLITLLQGIHFKICYNPIF
jgi:succinyl-diaminopimelate desuccinylase